VEMSLLVKVFVVYDTKYGNTKLAGETIVEGIREVEGIETSIGYVKEIDIVFGSADAFARSWFGAASCV
jgi:multimeric flavodoxin WrbA